MSTDKNSPFYVRALGGWVNAQVYTYTFKYNRNIYTYSHAGMYYERVMSMSHIIQSYSLKNHFPQRRARKRGELPQHMIRALDSLGFPWKVRHVKGWDEQENIASFAAAARPVPVSLRPVASSLGSMHPLQPVSAASCSSYLSFASTASVAGIYLF